MFIWLEQTPNISNHLDIVFLKCSSKRTLCFVETKFLGMYIFLEFFPEKMNYSK